MVDRGPRRFYRQSLLDFLLGRAYSKLGRPEEAKAAFQKLSELNRAEVQGGTKIG